jgi:DnaK suppressor protein
MSVPSELIEECRAELERQLAHLERSMSVTEEAVRPVKLDQQSVGRLSRMDSLQNQHMSRNLQEREQARHAAIVAALARIKAGVYGVCVECGAEIEPGRLIVFPEAGHCPRCAG